MPLIEASFTTNDGNPDIAGLIYYGPTTNVVICGAEIPEDTKTLKTKTIPALIDTGASHSCIDIEVAIDLDLIQVDQILIAGASGAKEHPVYLAHIFIPQLDIIQYGKFTGVNLKSGGQSQEALLGRDFLRNVIMIYDGIRSQVTLASQKSP